MIPVIEQRADELKRLCLQYGVRRLDLFGSAATGPYDPEESDLDFLVEFQPAALDAYADAYFGLLEALGRLFGRPVDLVVESAIKNPYFLQSVERTRTPVYEA
ncbi:MAG: nucleotidyltransferase domain-containing protein [Bryobacterales bacterium]|nr:nucleotidyltransferase domain-containing protein [Bryobacterales bacterium]